MYSSEMGKFLGVALQTNLMELLQKQYSIERYESSESTANEQKKTFTFISDLISHTYIAT